MVRPLSSLAKFSFVISNIRFSPRKRAAWRDTGMPASHYACQSPSNKIGLFWARPHTAFFRLITCMCSRSLRRSATAIMPRVFRPRVFTGPRAHRHLKSNFKCYSMRWPAGWSARTLCLSFSRSSAPILPLLLRPAQDLLVRAGVDLTPNWVQTILGLNGHGLHPWEAEVIRQAGALADRLVLASNPAVQACRRMRLPADYLYVHRSAVA